MKSTKRIGLRLGVRVRESITRIEGVITARCEYIGGVPRYRIEASVNGKPEEFWYEEDRLAVLPKASGRR